LLIRRAKMHEKSSEETTIGEDRAANPTSAPDGPALPRQPQSAVTRDAMWKLLPGILLYNLLGRYVIWLRVRRYGLRLPPWISLSDIRAVSFVRKK
jgi:hypothetical protein